MSAILSTIIRLLAAAAAFVLHALAFPLTRSETGRTGIGVTIPQQSDRRAGDDA